jgi:hypothetical protein
MPEKYFPNDAKVLRSAMRKPTISGLAKTATKLEAVTDARFDNIFIRFTVDGEEILTPINRQVLKRLKMQYDALDSMRSRVRGGEGMRGGITPPHASGQPKVHDIPDIVLPPII